MFLFTKKSLYWTTSLQLVLRKPYYLVLAISCALLFMIFSFSLAIRSILAFSWHVPAASLGRRIYFLLKSGTLAIPLNLSTHAIIFIIITAILTGINIALLFYYIRKRASFFSGSTAGFLGMLSAIVGIGCASCGSVLLTSLIGLSASSAIINFLPLKGIEFNVLAITLLLYSTYLVAKKLLPENILTCEVN